VEADKKFQLFKTLSQEIRIKILKSLDFNNKPLSFSRLQKEVLSSHTPSINFSFHLKVLKRCNLIDSSEDGYVLTEFGKKILNNILSIEQIFDDKNKKIMIRTSKYSKEPFNLKKVEEFLVREGGMDPNGARQIAREVEERLFKTNIEYLTAPLMREYINAILLENGYENVRHKLTRLGTPPHEVSKFFASDEIDPEKFIKRLGSDVSEQFLLLNLLPKHLADMYLSGEIALLSLNYWSLRPLGLYIPTDRIMDYILKKKADSFENLETSKGLTIFILRFFEFLSFMKPYFSADVLLGNFNQKFLSMYDFNKKEKTSHFFNIIASEIIRHDEEFRDNTSHLSLEFIPDYKNSSEELLGLISLNDYSFLEFLNNKENTCQNQAIPLILIDYSKKNVLKLNPGLIKKLLPSYNKKKLIFYNQNSNNLINTTNINVKSFPEGLFNTGRIILDKILLNLYHIALDANHNDDVFFDLIQERLYFIFELFSHKEILIKKKLGALKAWNALVSSLFGDDSKWIKNSLKSVSFFGLNAAINFHCGIELDRIQGSEAFAIKILTFLKEIIAEENQKNNDNFILSQPHEGKYLNNLDLEDDMQLRDNPQKFTSKIIRDDSSLSIDKKIALFKKFEKILDGGCVFNSLFVSDNQAREEQLRYLFQSNLKAFSIY